MTNNDFAFFTGAYDVANRWRKDFLDPIEGDDRWEEFPGITRATSTTAARSGRASSGPSSPPTAPTGSRRFPSTTDRPGSPTGTWTSPGAQPQTVRNGDGIAFRVASSSSRPAQST
ncbi:hypothetical protein ACFV1F_20915 [Streptomyces sp. NPDC059590]|uniref:hypothetical protein n=1 Tax=Streptomyces sp. NPDC059590 TaxID=3346877 RepID=UPI0036D11022